MKLYSVLVLLAEWSITLSMTSQGSAGDGDIADKFKRVRRRKKMRGAKGHRGIDQER